MAPAHRLIEADLSPLKSCPRSARRVRRVAFAAVLFFAASVLAHADEFWKRKPSSEWTLAQALKLVQHSAWSHEEVMPVTVLEEEASWSIRSRRARDCDTDALDPNGRCIQKRIDNPVDTSRLPNATPEATPSWAVLVRWESAAPIQLAFARLAQLDAKAAAEYQSRPPRVPPDRYVVTVKMVESGPHMIDPFTPPVDGKPVFKAFLRTRRGMLEANEREYSGSGAAAAIHFFFPREIDGAPLFGPEREEVQFILQGAQFRIKSKFTLDPEILR
jgi:hypothetical protein